MIMKRDSKSTPKTRSKSETEFAGSLTPDLDHPGRSKAHPFRYTGPDRAHNAPRGQDLSEG